MTLVNTAISEKRHLDWIDILRGLAAYFVVVYHVRIDLWVGIIEIQKNPESYSTLDWALSFLSLPAIFGGSGVMLFFLLSGFCVHLPEANKPRKLNLKVYTIRRLFRIVPPYLAAVLLTFLTEQVISSVSSADSTPANNWLYITTMTQNYFAAQPIANVSLWSLPVEVELYAAYVLFHIVSYHFNVTISMAMASLVSLVVFIVHIVWRIEVGGNFAIYWLIWCSGALLAEWHQKDRIPNLRPLNLLFAFAALLGGVLSTIKHWDGALSNYFWAFFYFHVIWWLLLKPNIAKKAPPYLTHHLTKLGVISYSLYLIHWPFFYAAGEAWKIIFNQKPTNFLVPIIFSILVLPLAGLFWRLVERPSHQLARKLSKLNKTTV